MERIKMRKYTLRDILATSVLWVVLSFLTDSTSQTLTSESEPTFVATDTNNGLNIITNFTGSALITCQVDGGDDDLYLSELNNLTDVQEILVEFAEHGFKDIHMTCLGTTSFFLIPKPDFYVGFIISGVEVDNGTSATEIPIPSPVSADIVYCVYFENGTDVDIEFTVLGNPTYTLHNATHASTSCNSLSSAYFPQAGLYTLEVKLSNPLGISTYYVVFAVQTEMQSPDIRMPQYAINNVNSTYVLVNHPINIEFTSAVPAEDMTYTLTIETTDNALTDIVGETCTGDGEIEHILSYTLPNTTMYYLIAEMSNFVSNYSVTFNITTVYAVNNFSLALNFETALYTQTIAFSLTIDSSAQLKMGLVTCMLTYDDDSTTIVEYDCDHPTYQDLPVKTSTQTHSYAQESWYTANVTCYNSLPAQVDSIVTSQTFIRNLNILHPVENLLILENDSPNITHHPFSEELQIIIGLSSPSDLPLSNITCTSEYGDPVTGNATSTSNITLVLKFNEALEYNVAINCSNELTYQILYFQITVFYDCWKAPVKFFLNPDPWVGMTHQPKSIQASVALTNNCNGSALKTNWRVIKITENVEEVVSDITDPTVNTNKNFNSSELAQGYYRIQLTTIYTDLGANHSDVCYLNMTNPPLVALIKANGSSLESHAFEWSKFESLRLDASGSYDPVSASTPTTFSWSCRKGAGLTQVGVDKYADTGNLPSEASENCDSFYTSNNAAMSIITIPSGTLNENAWYLFTLTYSDMEDRSTTIFKAVHITNGPILHADIICISNCAQTPEKKGKLVISDLNIQLKITNPDVTPGNVLYNWTVETLDTDQGAYVIVDLPDTNAESGLTVSAMYLKGKSKFKIKCEVRVPDYGPKTVTQFYDMNQAPYGGTCTWNGDIPKEIKAAVDEVCVTCLDWKDEDNGDLHYSVKQYTLNATGHINESYSPIVLRRSAVPSVCVKLHKPPDGLNHVHIRVVIEDHLLEPSASVDLGNVTVKPPIEDGVSGDDGADQINDFVQSFSNEIASAEALNDVVKLGEVVSLVTGSLPKYSEAPPAMPIAEPGDLGDLSGGTPVGAEDAMGDIMQKKPDATLISAQKATKDVVSVYHNLINAEAVRLENAPLNCVNIGNALAGITQGDQKNFDQETKGNIVDLARTVFAMGGLTTEDGAIKDNVQAVMLEVSASVAKAVVPNEAFEVVKTLADVRKDSAIAALFLSAETIHKKESAIMTDEERVFFNKKRQEATRSEVQKMVDTANEFSKAVKGNNKNITQSVQLSPGGTKTIGYSQSSLTVTNDTAANLADKKVRAENTAVGVKGLSKLSGSVQMGLSQMTKVTSIDSEGQSGKITTPEYTLFIAADEDISGIGPISISTRPDMKEPVVMPAEIDPEDPSSGIYTVQGCEPNKDVLIIAVPSSDEILSINVYIKSIGESISIINYDATQEAKSENGFSVLFKTGTFKCDGAIKVLFQTKMKDTSPAARRRRSAAQGTGAPTFNMSTTVMACMTFDDSTNSWRTDECSGTWNPSTGELNCLCKPKKELTFASSFYVPPNTIDFSNVFLKFSPLNQAAVMSVLILVFLIYVFVILWARRQDRKDLLKWGITPLSDNFSEDNYFYVIKVFTGMRPGAGTRSRVSMVVAGDDMDTGVRELADGVREEFVTGSVMNYLMSTSGYLGDLDYTRIWHDNSGGGNNASWYLSKIEIHDIQRNEMFVFLAERWLAIEKEDCVLECVLPICKTENLNKFGNRFFLNAKDNLAESHIWVSVAYRPQASNFTRVQRASCALLFVMLTMIANAMFFKTSDEGNYETPSELQVGPFRFSLQQVYTSMISALIVTPPTILVIYLFKLAKNQLNPHDKIFKQKKRERGGRYKVPFMSNWFEEEQRRSMELERHLVTKGIPINSGFRFPHKVVYLAWLLVVAGSFISAFFVMLFSMEWGKQKSEEWVTTFIMSFFESVFCLDPIKVGVMALVFALIFRSTQEPEAPVDRGTIMKNYSTSLRGQSGGTRLPAPPLDHKKLEKARSVRQRELLMKTAFRDVIVNVVMIWILFSISYSNRDTRSYNMLKETTDKLLDPINLPQFTQIKSINEYFDWLRNTSVKNMFPETEIDGNKTALHWRLRQFTQGGTLFRVGPPRLRQVRTTKKSCHNPYFGTEDCFKKYSQTSEDDKSYCIGWKEGKCPEDEKLYKFSSDAWKFTSAMDVWGMPITGYYTTYSGGGYIAKLAVNRQVSDLILDELYNNSWIDRQTRAVLFEFTLYCLNANIFTYNMFMVEFPETGGAFPYYNIFPLKIYQHLGALGKYTLLCEVIFVLYQVFCTISMIVMIVQQKKSFFKKPWQVYDFLFTILGYVAIIMYLIRYVFVDMSLDIFREDKKEFVNFYHVALWNQSLVLLIGVLVFMATLRMLNILGYNKRISALARVFTEAADELVWFGIFFLYVFTCYSAFGFLLFGSKLKSYMNVFKAMGTLFVSMIGKSRFTEIDNTDPVMSKIYFIIFIFFVVYMILTMFLAILSKAIDEVHADTKKDKGDEMVDYVIKKVSGYLSYGSRSRTPTVNPTTTRLTSAKANKRKLNAAEVSKMDHREILQEIRQTMNEALTSNPRDFTTPCDERKERKVTFRR